MDLLSHWPETEDLVMCAALIEDAFVFDEKERVSQVTMWQQLLDEKRAQSIVIKDRHRPAEACIVGFGLGIFLSEEFAQQVHEQPVPYLGRQIFSRWLERCEPVLSREEIQRANGDDGLHWLNLHCVWATDCASDTETSQLQDEMLHTMLQALSGYQLKSMTVELYGTRQHDILENFGYQCHSDYRHHFAQCPVQPPSHQHPYLFGLTREGALHPRLGGTYARALFAYQKPRFGFSNVQQELLRAALDGQANREIAATLCRLEVTIRKQWRRIYEQVMEVDEKLFCECNAHSDAARRGAEKKRVLLKYLRDHPEELRPH